MNKFTYIVQNAVIPVIYVGVGVHIHVKCVIRHSLKRVAL